MKVSRLLEWLIPSVVVMTVGRLTGITPGIGAPIRREEVGLLVKSGGL